MSSINDHFFRAAVGAIDPDNIYNPHTEWENQPALASYHTSVEASEVFGGTYPVGATNCTMAKYTTKTEDKNAGPFEESRGSIVRVPITPRKKSSTDGVCQTSPPIRHSGRRLTAPSCGPSVDRLCQTTAPSETSKLFARRLAERGVSSANSEVPPKQPQQQQPQQQQQQQPQRTIEASLQTVMPLSLTLDASNVFRQFAPRSGLSTDISAKTTNVVDFDQMDRLTSVATDKIHHSAALGQYLRDLYHEKKGIDVCIRIENQIFHAHRVALACQSQYFENLFFDVSKARTKLPMDMKVHGIATDSFRAFLNFVYTGEVIIKADMMADLYVLAGKLSCIGLLERCQVFADNMTLDQALIVITNVIHDTPVYEQSYEILRKNFIHLAGWKMFCNLDVDTVCQLLADDKIQVPSEIFVFNTAIAWLNNQEYFSEELIYKVMSNIRYSLLTSKQLIYCCQNNEIFRYYPPCKNLILQANWLSTVRLMGETKGTDIEKARAAQVGDEAKLEANADLIPAVLKKSSCSVPQSDMALLQPLIPPTDSIRPASATSPTLRRRGVNSARNPRPPTSKPFLENNHLGMSNTPASRPSQHGPQSAEPLGSHRSRILPQETTRARKVTIVPEGSKVVKKTLKAESAKAGKSGMPTPEYSPVSIKVPSPKAVSDRKSTASQQSAGSPTKNPSPKAILDRKGTQTPDSTRALRKTSPKEILDRKGTKTPESTRAPRKTPSPKAILDRKGTKTPESTRAPRKTPSHKTLLDRRGTIPPESDSVPRKTPSPKTLLGRRDTETPESSRNGTDPPKSYPIQAGRGTVPHGSTTSPPGPGTRTPASPRCPNPGGRRSPGPSNASSRNINDHSSHTGTGDILAIGGYQKHNKNPKDGRNIERYSPIKNEWVHFSAIPEQINQHAAAIFEGKLYLTGGSEMRGKLRKTPQTCDRVFVFDMENSAWKEVCPMTSNRRNHALCPLLGRLYAVGGEDERGRVLNTVERYNPQDDTWTPIAPMNHARVGAGVTVCNGRLYVAGGCGEPDRGFKRFRPVLRSLECFDPKCHRWIPKHDLRLPRCYASLVTSGGKLYLCGGATSPSDRKDSSLASLPDIDVFDGTLNCWQLIANLTVPRHKAGSAVIGKKIYMIGGVSSPNNTVLQSVECYNIATESWETGVKRIPYPDQSLRCVVVPTGTAREQLV